MGMLDKVREARELPGHVRGAYAVATSALLLALAALVLAIVVGTRGRS